MNHPTREEWMSYLYDELDAGHRSELMAHLQVCRDCGVQLNEWRATRKHLDVWLLRARELAVPVQQTGTFSVLTVLKWAAVAAMVLGIGFGAGRLASASASVEKIRAVIEPELRQQLRQEFAQVLREELTKTASATLAASNDQTEELLADYATALETKNTEDNRALYVALARLESQHDADYVSLKKELDTVAVNTDAGLRQTEQQLVQLADATPPFRNSNPLEK